MGTSTLTRADIVPAGSALMACIEEHERLFPVAEAMRLASVQRAGEGVPEELDTLIRREAHFRASFAARVGMPDEDLWGYFGRPLWAVLIPLHSDYRRYDPKTKSASNC